MFRYILAGLAALAAVLAIARFTDSGDGGDGEGAGSATWNWQGNVAAGSWLHIRNTNGRITVGESGSDEVKVRATKRWRRGDPKDVHFMVVSSGSDVTVCALWSKGGHCASDGYRTQNKSRFWHGGNDTSVEFVVELPRGVKVDVSTINGEIAIADAAAPVHARTVNGDIKAATAVGPVDARTVNGSIVVSMDSLAGTDDVELKTVNGSVTATLPAALDADIEAITVNGRFTTDFAVTLPERRPGPKKVNFRIGAGSHDVKLATVNGSVELRKGKS